MHTAPPDWFTLLQQALHANPQPAARYLQLASLDDSGAVTCRTLVCRALLDATASLVMTTDLRSTKVKGLRHQPQAEACWYLPARQQQFRLRGNVTLKGAGRNASLRDELWERMSEASRQTFTRPAPGHSLGPDSAFAHPAPTRPPECFGVLILQPFRVDYLDLAAQPHQRRLFEYRAREWHQRPLNP